MTYGAMVAPSLEAADRLSKEGVEVEVIDLRSLLPFDKDAIFASLDKTSRVLVVHEDVKTLGLGAELSAVIVEERFDALDAPVIRVTYPDSHVPFSQVLEAANLPNSEHHRRGIEKAGGILTCSRTTPAPTSNCSNASSLAIRRRSACSMTVIVGCCLA